VINTVYSHMNTAMPFVFFLVYIVCSSAFSQRIVITCVHVASITGCVQMALMCGCVVVVFTLVQIECVHSCLFCVSMVVFTL